MTVADRDFESVFETVLEGWLDHDLPVIAAGMIGSRQGWVETPYLPCPAGADDLARALVPLDTPRGRRIHFVPGLSCRHDGVPDVMRGEETQVIGDLGGSRERRILVLPGTHSKWAVADSGRITGFTTFMTGELFAVLTGHSILGRLMTPPPPDHSPDPGVFDRGVDAGAKGQTLHRLFSTRTLGLFGEVAPDVLRDHLSGLLIGAEIAEAAALCALGPGDGTVIGLIGSPTLSRPYHRALARLGFAAEDRGEAATLRGLVHLARAAGLVAGD